ncbi:MAG: hypothetical protein AAF922_09315 [Pseudomonadota bacterium]
MQAFPTLAYPALADTTAFDAYVLDIAKLQGMAHRKPGLSRAKDDGAYASHVYAPENSSLCQAVVTGEIKTAGVALRKILAEGASADMFDVGSCQAHIVEKAVIHRA